MIGTHHQARRLFRRLCLTLLPSLPDPYPQSDRNPFSDPSPRSLGVLPSESRPLVRCGPSPVSLPLRRAGDEVMRPSLSRFLRFARFAELRFSAFEGLG